MKKADFLSKQKAKNIQVTEQLKQKTHLYIQAQTAKKAVKIKKRYLLLFPSLCVLFLALTFQSPFTKIEEQPVPSLMEQKTKVMPVLLQTQIYENNEIKVWMNEITNEKEKLIFHLSIEKFAGNATQLTIHPFSGTLSFENKEKMENIPFENGMSISYSYIIDTPKQKTIQKAFTISLDEQQIIPFQMEHTNDSWVLSPY